jgi:hypothetical protein
VTHDIDHSLYKEGEPTWPEYLFWKPMETAEQYRTAAKREFIVTVFCTLASFVLFMTGLYFVLSMAAQFKFG